MPETIRAFIRPTETFGGIGNHMWVVYTNSAGQSYSLSGWSNTQGSILSGWGTIDTQVTSWAHGAFDFGYTPITSQIIATSSNLSSQW